MAKKKKNMDFGYLLEPDNPVHRPSMPLLRRNAVAAEIYATNLLYVSSSVSMAQLFAAQVQNMSRHENLATLAVFYGPNADRPSPNTTNETVDAKILAQVKKNAALERKIVSEMNGAPVVT